MMSEESVIIYSKPNCPSCVKAKAQFEKMKVPYTTKNIGTDIQPQELFGIF